jgi:hypothetical protein
MFPLAFAITVSWSLLVLRYSIERNPNIGRVKYHLEDYCKVCLLLSKRCFVLLTDWEVNDGERLEMLCSVQ